MPGPAESARCGVADGVGTVSGSDAPRRGMGTGSSVSRSAAGSGPPGRPVQQLHRVEQRQGGETGELREAAEIAGGHRGCPAALDMGGLAAAQGLGHAGLKHVVGARRPAAEMALRDVPHLEAGAAKEGARLLADILRVLQRARIVIGHDERYRGLRQAQLLRRQQFGDVAGDGRERRGFAAPRRIAFENARVVLDHGPAAGCVDRDGVEAAGTALRIPGVDDARRGGGRHLRLAHMEGQRAAATRPRRHRNLEAVAGKQPDRRGVDLRRQDLLDAALQQGNARPPRAFGGMDAGQVGGRWEEGRRQVDQVAQSPRQQRPDGPGEARQTGHAGKTGGFRYRPRDQPTQQAVAERAAMVRFDMGPGYVGEMQIVHVDRAGRHATVAGQAAVDMADRLGVGPTALFQHFPDQIDPPAGRFVLVAGEHIGRTDRGAEAVMHAGPQNPVGRRDLGIGELFGAEIGLQERPRV